MGGRISALNEVLMSMILKFRQSLPPFFSEITDWQAAVVEYCRCKSKEKEKPNRSLIQALQLNDFQFRFHI